MPRCVACARAALLSTVLATAFCDASLAHQLFESMHPGSRSMAEYSNRLRLGRDIAIQAARVARTRALIRGGTAMDSKGVQHPLTPAELAILANHDVFRTIRDVAGCAETTFGLMRPTKEHRLCARAKQVLAVGGFDVDRKESGCKLYNVMRLNRRHTVFVEAWVRCLVDDVQRFGAVLAIVTCGRQVAMLVSLATTLGPSEDLHSAPLLSYVRNSEWVLLRRDRVLGTPSVMHMCCHEDSRCTASHGSVKHVSEFYFVNPYTMDE
jgi:hypothetical protein